MTWVVLKKFAFCNFFENFSFSSIFKTKTYQITETYPLLKRCMDSPSINNLMFTKTTHLLLPQLINIQFPSSHHLFFPTLQPTHQEKCIARLVSLMDKSLGRRCTCIYIRNASRRMKMNDKPKSSQSWEAEVKQSWT